MRLVIIEKPSVAQVLARVPGQTDALKEISEETHSPEGLQEPAKRKEVKCESFTLGRDRRQSEVQAEI